MSLVMSRGYWRLDASTERSCRRWLIHGCRLILAGEGRRVRHPAPFSKTEAGRRRRQARLALQKMEVRAWTATA